jgi:hypothetical protein
MDIRSFASYVAQFKDGIWNKTIKKVYFAIITYINSLFEEKSLYVGLLI